MQRAGGLVVCLVLQCDDDEEILYRGAGGRGRHIRRNTDELRVFVEGAGPPGPAEVSDVAQPIQDFTLI